MKKYLKFTALVLTALLVCGVLAACGSDAAESGTDENADSMYGDIADDISQDDSVYTLSFDAYPMSETAVLTLTTTDGNIEDTESIGFEANCGDSVEYILNSHGYAEIVAGCEYDEFEGWMMYDVTVTIDDDGNEVYERTLVTEDLYTTEEILSMTMPEGNRLFTAKWQEMPLSSYYYTEESI